MIHYMLYVIFFYVLRITFSIDSTNCFCIQMITLYWLLRAGCPLVHLGCHLLQEHDLFRKTGLDSFMITDFLCTFRVKLYDLEVL